MGDIRGEFMRTPLSRIIGFTNFAIKEEDTEKRYKTLSLSPAARTAADAKQADTK